MSSAQCSALSEYSEETEGSSARPPDPLGVEEVGTVEAQTVGIFRPIPRMMTDKRTIPNVVILLSGFLRGESPGDD